MNFWSTLDILRNLRKLGNILRVKHSKLIQNFLQIGKSREDLSTERKVYRRKKNNIKIYFLYYHIINIKIYYSFQNIQIIIHILSNTISIINFLYILNITVRLVLYKLIVKFLLIDFYFLSALIMQCFSHGFISNHIDLITNLFDLFLPFPLNQFLFLLYLRNFIFCFRGNPLYLFLCFSFLLL